MEHLHQVSAVTGDNPHDYFFYRDPVCPKTRSQSLKTVCLVYEIIDKDDRTVKGAYRPDLAF